MTVDGEIRDQHGIWGAGRKLLHGDGRIRSSHAHAVPDFKVIQAGNALHHNDEHIPGRTPPGKKRPALHVGLPQPLGQLGRTVFHPDPEPVVDQIQDKPVQGIVAGGDALAVETLGKLVMTGQSQPQRQGDQEECAPETQPLQGDEQRVSWA